MNAGQSYDEWAEPSDVHQYNWKDMVSPHPEVSTAYTVFVLRLMKEIAHELGKTGDEALYHRYSEGCKRAYQALMELPEFSPDTDCQAKLVRPLALKLLTEEQTAFAKDRLLLALERYGWRLGTGFLSTPLILKVLREIDAEAAYRLLENEELPGWLSMPKNGATTIWETWEGHLANNLASLNHYSKGAVAEWLFSEMCGIQIAGENRFVIAPIPGGHFPHAKATYKSVFGTVSCGWLRVGDAITYHIDIPPNCTAQLRLPDGSERELTAGSHE